MSRDEIVRREAQRVCFCRGCNDKLAVGTEIIYTYSMANRGMNIIFCLKCAKQIGELASANGED